LKIEEELEYLKKIDDEINEMKLKKEMLINGDKLSDRE